MGGKRAPLQLRPGFRANDDVRIAEPSGEGISTTHRRGGPDSTDVFCGSYPDRPEVLFETPNFYVIPDLFPVSPGHVLVIPKHHRPAYGAVPAHQQAEYSYALERARSFIRDSYGQEPMVWENGGVGQSVHHAHLHLIPVPCQAEPLPAAVLGRPISDFSALRSWWRSGKRYHYMDFESTRELLPEGSPDVHNVSLWKLRALKIPVAADGVHWVRQRDPIALARCVMLWRRWEASHPQQQFLPPQRAGRSLA